MRLNYVKYDKKYLKESYTLMLDTWTFDSNLEGLKNREVFYKFLFQSFQTSSNYNEVVLNEKDEVVGYIFANLKKEKQPVISLSLYFNWFFDILRGKYGKRANAFKFYKQLYKLHDDVMKDSNLFDSEINLFFVSSKVRGEGVGKKILNNFIETCKKNNINNTSLQTDTDCNYGFYDYCGFELHNEVYSKLYPKTKGKYNTFCYTMKFN